MADNTYSSNQAYSLENQLNEARETPLFYKVFALAGAGMILDAADVYMAGAINSTLIQTKFASISQGSYFLSSGFLGLFIGSLLAGYIGDFLGENCPTTLIFYFSVYLHCYRRLRQV